MISERSCCKVRPFTVSMNLDNINFNGNHIVRRYEDIKSIFKSTDISLEDKNPVIYEVFESPVPEKQGHLIFLVTILYPGKVNEEFFMTKGHYHTVENTAEVYLGIKGKGLILCQTKSGDFEVAEISENRVVYIPPFWAHRAVNIFDEPLIFFGIYPAHAGHDYETIAQSGFVKRVFSKNGRVVIE